MVQEETWLTVKAASEKLGVHPTTLRRWANAGNIPVMLTPGGHRRFLESDLLQFTDERRRLKVVAGLERLWAENALTRAREEIVSHQGKDWFLAFDEQDRAHKRQLGRRMMGLLLQYVSLTEGGEAILEEARAIGSEHAEHALNMGIPSTEALRVAMIFRDVVVEAALDLPETANVRPETNVLLLRRINTLLNVVQLAITQRYDMQRA